MAENRMELFIETLTGTAFELSCSPLETIVSIKAKIQYSEGIPVSQQHLIWKSQELNDNLCLQDYSINDGATLKLVLGMRGGPINTRQDTRKIKDLTDLVERNSETAGSEGRPLTVLVFHDGDRVHMYYTLIKRGSISPMSETVSETSSVTSIKHIEEFDQEIAKEHEATREKVAQLQEQLKVLNINRPKRITKKSIPASKTSLQLKPEKRSEAFHLPPIQCPSAMTDLSTSHNAQAVPPLEASGFLPSMKEDVGTIAQNSLKSSGKQQSALDFVSNNISTYILASPDTNGGSCSNFLPYLQSSSSLVQRDPFPSHSSPVIAVNLTTPVLGSIVKRDPSKRGQLPFTSGQAVAPRKLLDLDVWLQARPKTSPGKTECSSGRSFSFVMPGKSFFKGPASEPERKSKPSLLMQAKSLDSPSLGSLFSSSIKALKPLNESERRVDSDISGIKNTTKYSDETSNSNCKLPLIKPKKKSHKRCFQCSRKTGLATSYTCRCGKNFCASHRYAEVHHCSYDYKTEGRRLLQLNNPVVTASKLPKI